MRKITAFGSNEQEFMEHFEAQRSKMDLSCALEAQGDNSEMKGYTLDFEQILQSGQLVSNSSNMMQVSSHVQPALLEIGSSQGTWIPTTVSDFAPSKWFPMLAGIGHKVGQGSFGKVYVIDTDMGNLPGKEIPLAIKMELAKDGIKDSEVRNGMDLDHPNVIKVWDYSQVGSRRVMLMESASGGDLEKAHIQHSRQVRAKVMLEMFAAMHYLHQQGYYMRTQISKE